MPAVRRHSRRQRNDGNSAPRTETLAGLLALVLIGLVIAAGAVLMRHSNDAHPAVDLLVGADDTASVHAGKRKQVFGVLDETVSELLPQNSTVDLWSYDVNAHQFGSQQPIHAEDLWPAEDRIMALHPTTYGTHPGVVLEDMEARAQQDDQAGKPVVILLLTDGEDQNPKETRKALMQLENDSMLRAVWFCGATGSNGFLAMLNRRWKPILGNKLIVTGKFDSQHGLDELRTLLNGK